MLHHLMEEQGNSGKFRRKYKDRGKFFIYPQDEVYAGQVVGEHVHNQQFRLFFIDPALAFG